MRKFMCLWGLLLLVCCVSCTVRPQAESIGDEKATEEHFNGATLASPKLLTHLGYLQSVDRWEVPTHNNITQVCARFWNLSAARIENMRQASEMPDTYQSGLDNAYNQQWSHAYLYNSLGWWTWGDADDDFHDNLLGDSGEWESPEGYQAKHAGYFYAQGDQYQGDWYVGYACHYIEDVALIMHASFPSLDMLTKHFAFEQWVQNNLHEGHCFLKEIENDPHYYQVTDPKTAIRTAAYQISYGNSDLGKAVWDAYQASDYPTLEGTGSEALISHTRTMVREAGRFTKGAIKYALDHYGQWVSTY